MRFQAQPSQKKKKNKIAATGGAYRAFVRIETLGGKGRPDLGKVAAKYAKAKATNSESYRQACSIAKAANLRAKVSGGALGNTLGSNSRAVRKHQLKFLHLAVWRNTKEQAPEARLRFIGDVAMQQGLSLRETLTLARAAVRFDNAEERRLQEDAMQQLVQYREGPGAALVAQLQKAMPKLDGLDLRPVPGPCACVEVLPPTPETVFNAVAWSQQNQATDIGSQLEAEWQRLHLAVEHEDTPDLPTEEIGASACAAAGLCLCTDNGRRVRRLTAALDVHMRKRFPPNSEARNLLLEGFVVMCLTGEPSAEDYEDVVMADDSAFVTAYFHVGLHYLRPFRPTMMALDIVDSGDEAPAVDGRLYVKAPWHVPSRKRKSMQVVLSTPLLICQVDRTNF